ncbi:MAG: methyltransferase domain-containing protein [Nitrospirota bacterium]|nr:methyltransferase domain-containing protein [Nitrospirota bacterium]
MTDAMLEIARRNAPVVARHLSYADSNVEFRKGHAAAMPVADNSIDLIISNCVINLASDKEAVFREMFRILKPGGRFTISDIVADRPVPNYLIQDTVKLGDCLSGALQIRVYMAGMVEAGFLGLHQIKHVPWQVLDGIHFLSLTFTGYKLPMEPISGEVQFAMLRGPFRRVMDERGHRYERGRPEPIDRGTVRLLQAPPFHDLFLLTIPRRLSTHPTRLGVRSSRRQILASGKAIMRSSRDRSSKWRTTIIMSIDAGFHWRFARKRSPCSNHPPIVATLPSSIARPNRHQRRKRLAVRPGAVVERLIVHTEMR